VEKYVSNKTDDNGRAWNYEERKSRGIAYRKFKFKKEKYKTVMELAKEDWLLSTDGVVKALRYNTAKKQFVAKVHYQKGTKELKEHIPVSDDWVIDTYGKEIASKLIDRDEHQEFIKPVNDDGMLTVVKLDERKIIG
jgi:hypothetical protein